MDLSLSVWLAVEIIISTQKHPFSKSSFSGAWVY
jgi:hypothetical protein